VYGLSVRWSLADAPAEVAEELRRYVCDTSLARFTGRPGLNMKTWRMVPEQWFEGTYVFSTAHERDQFLAEFSAVAAESPGSQIVGSPPIAMEPFEVVAIAEGGVGFVAGPGPGGR
jgi:hypothetical protein